MSAPQPFIVIILRMIQRSSRILDVSAVLLFWSALLTYSNPPITDQIERIRAYTRQIEFNYINWTLNAVTVKFNAASIGIPYSLNPAVRKQIVTEYLQTTQRVLEQEYMLEQVYADAKVKDKESASADLRRESIRLNARLVDLAPLAEAILQEQVTQILAEIGLTTAGQPLPEVLYHASPLPMALIVSPRDRIEQTANISIDTDLTVDEQAQLEDRVDAGLSISSLVVPIGGIGVYPTMVMRSTDLNWILSTVAHEWTHNYLTLRPLGLLYEETPELRTMNETAASIAGNEIGSHVLERFYPELAHASSPGLSLISLPVDHPEPGDGLRPVFDFRAEMHTTRVVVDALLAEGKIDEAEEYMESRRLIFLNHGYLLRKINQAYFAFYGAYADVPGGAAGEDPVGPAVRTLRERSPSLADFLNRIAWMTSFKQLQAEIGK
jgi:hypothetical protein